jgi:N-acetylglucosamine kinase-like BadF-type ATPase
MTDFKISSLRIGVDGGGTKTEFILIDAAGVIVARHTAPGCNPSQCGPEKSREILTIGLDALLAAAPVSGPRPSVSGLHLFMAGSATTWRDLTSGLNGYGTITLATDSLPVLELATAGAPGLVLHAGTGSFVAARAPDGTVHYAGGLGWKIGDPGSGYDLGRRGIAQAMLELQGWSASSGLDEALQTHTGLAGYAAISRLIYNDPAANAVIAGFAPRVIELAAQGCPPAQIALTETLTELVGQARLITTKLFGETTVPCGVSGAILNSEPASFALPALVSAHRWPVTLNFITTPPIEGVRRLLAKL